MNNIFDSNRLFLLLRQQFISHRKNYLMLTFTLMGGIALIFTMILSIFDVSSKSAHGDLELMYFSALEFRAPVFYAVGLLYTSFIAGNFYNNLSNEHRFQELSLPVSTFEKYLSGIILGVLGNIITYIMAFTVVDTLMVMALKSIYNVPEILKLAASKNFIGGGFRYFFQSTFFSINSAEVALFTFVALAVICWYLLGSVYFKGKHFLKSSVCLLLLIAIFIIHATLVHSIFYEGKVLINGEMERANFYSYYKYVLVFVMLGSSAATYVQLKEKEA